MSEIIMDKNEIYYFVKSKNHAQGEKSNGNDVIKVLLMLMHLPYILMKKH